MKVNKTDAEISFIRGGGEMGELIRRHHWSATSLGKPDHWPQSLKTTLSILLNSKFPMFLWWGPELLCFYNDAYRPSLGITGKHPSILGEPAVTAWPEIWPLIKPMIDQVLSGGESTWNEDQLIPIYRNGRLEDVYWTFSYSPVYDESGKPAGVFVTCSETTEKVINFRRLSESRDELARTIHSLEQKEMKLGKSEKHLRAILHQAPFAIAILRGPDYVVEIANERALELWGRKFEEVNGKPILHAMPELAGQGIKELLDRVYHTGEIFSASELPVDLIRKGSLKTTYIDFSYEALHATDGSISAIMAVGVEVTNQVLSRRKLEQLLSEQRITQEKLNIIIDASELGTWELDLLTDRIEYSDRYLEIFGYEKVSAPDHEKMLDRLHPEDRQQRNEAVLDSLKTGILYYDSKIIWEDESVHWIEVQGKVFYDEEKKPVRLIGTLRDITELKRQQQELQESAQKFRLLADSMPQFVWTGDANGNLNYFNRSVYSYSGLSEEKVNAEGWLQIVHPDEREKNIEVWANSVKTGVDFHFEHRFRRYDGQYHWQLSRAIPQKDELGNIQMWVGTSTDIEAQKSFSGELEQLVEERTIQLAQKNQELENMNKELQSFAYVSSHDLQEPLRKIQTFSGRLLETDTDKLSEEGKYSVSRIVNSVERMRKLINDLLSYSRISSGNYVFENTRLTDIIQEVQEELSEVIKEKNAQFEISGIHELKIIRFQFVQLFQNLISNSLKFSSPERPLRIIISMDRVTKKNQSDRVQFLSPPYVHIRMEDNGIGFEPEYQRRIFELFQRLHSKAEYSGTGVGLAIVKKIVENHQGEIQAEGLTGRGAVFHIYLPA